MQKKTLHEQDATVQPDDNQNLKRGERDSFWIHGINLELCLGVDIVLITQCKVNGSSSQGQDNVCGWLVSLSGP